MFAYPFQYLYLKSALTRTELAERLTQVSYLSDENYKKTSQNTSVFFGEVSPIDFNLEHISKKQKSVNFVRGKFLGADSDMYVKIRLGAWQHQRVYFMLVATLFTMLGFLIYYVMQEPQGFRYPQEYYQLYGYNSSETAYNLGTPLALIMEAIMAIIAIIIGFKYRNFRNNIQPTVNYLKGLWEADAVLKHEVPLIFQ
jgi:hypothetical protein